MATISTHNGTKVAIEHNRRNVKVVSKERHIDLERPHETWIDRDIRDVYHEVFDDAIKAYNAKQKRSDRRIKDYYDKIRDSKDKHVCYEMIVGVYDDSTSPEIKKQMLKEFVDTWQERNPNLIICGAYYHHDEESKDPHVHIDYIPVAHNCKRGLSVQNALNKALEQQGYKSTDIHHTAQIAWEKAQNEYLERLCLSRDISVEHDAIKRDHLKTNEYKASMIELERTKAKAKSRIESVKPLENNKKSIMGMTLVKKADFDSMIKDYNDMYALDTEMVSKFDDINTNDTVVSVRELERDNECLEIENGMLKNELRRSEIELNHTRSKVKQLENKVNELEEQVEQSVPSYAYVELLQRFNHLIEMVSNDYRTTKEKIYERLSKYIEKSINTFKSYEEYDEIESRSDDYDLDLDL